MNHIARSTSDWCIRLSLIHIYVLYEKPLPQISSGLTREELYDRVEDAQKKIAEVVFHRENPTVEEYCEKWLLMRSGTVRTNTLEGYARMVNRYIVGPIGPVSYTHLCQHGLSSDGQ